jgi:hypothetical protein
VAVPLASLAGWGLERLWNVRQRRFFVGPALAAVIAIATIGFNFVSTWRIFQQDAATGYMMAWSGEQIAGESWPWSLAAKLPAGSKVLLVGNATAFYFPPDSVYATAFDDQLLDQFIRHGLSVQDILSRLKGLGITHIYVDWSEIFRLASTYGFPASLSEDLLACQAGKAQPRLKILDQLRGLGMLELPAESDKPDHRFVPSSGWDKHDLATQPAQASWPKASLFALP